jgi:DNA-binding CsgD family transcriptional regulator
MLVRDSVIPDAHGLTARERAVTQLVANGLATEEIARRLFVSPYTVQDHLKAIFEKTDVNSRGALVARLFFEHYAPRAMAGTQLDANGWFARPPTADRPTAEVWAPLGPRIRPL